MFAKGFASLNLTRASVPNKGLSPVKGVAGALPSLLTRDFGHTPIQFRERIRIPEIDPPVKPKSPYLRYMHYLIEEEKKFKPYAKINPIEFGQKVASPAWESLFETQKEPYESAYHDAYKLYKPEERNWWMTKTFSDISHINNIRRESGAKQLSIPAEYRKEMNRSEREAKQADKATRTKGLANARNRYMSEIIPQLTLDLGDSKHAMKAASQMWKDLSEEDKEPYQKAFRIAKAERDAEREPKI
ncbi:hypothetical protein E3P89_01261 [Wallemia ichthyophaga]|uniref:HMG box domain-containing protein n=2 Tax=Wallemia ichthyophaga TaxID=245174 RepID=A0A4T0GKQ5_WALIC|nr:uncharacterized protein J056_001969 [Wallemia ichthyophaga EXF-994]TIB02043.1 hypothetical protein E3P95_01132 [Wallemia ichthyophaga]EOR03891.1 hypothetical protein J056_001969 [Wallemia ichthyophaga EXF-994]TIB02916.1 hypothetical protein E3P94_01264 [Wallemia ichthyophaga]TIB13483.1 hypothetical protein E3P90_01661 [Wallemia ichthyophaga]TIB15260.1 hypothetical protein E3P93_01411 [Wallemia ichthyophaga]